MFKHFDISVSDGRFMEKVMSKVNADKKTQELEEKQRKIQLKRSSRRLLGSSQDQLSEINDSSQNSVSQDSNSSLSGRRSIRVGQDELVKVPFSSAVNKGKPPSAKSSDENLLL